MTTQTIYVNKDTYIDSDSPSNNYGTESLMRIVNTESGSGTRRRGLTEFDLSGIPSGSTITDAALHIYVSTIDDTATYYFKRMTAQFNETTVCWNDQPSHTDDYSASISIGSTGWKTVTITDMTKAAFAAGDYAGIKLIGSDPNRYIKVDTRETSNDAYIVVTYTTSATDYYVKTTGDDSLNGESWDYAWQTVNKAATTVADGTTVHIGFGTYNAEPAGNKIAPQNIGTSGIRYKFVDPSTDGGTGTVSIEKN